MEITLTKEDRTIILEHAIIPLKLNKTRGFCHAIRMGFIGWLYRGASEQLVLKMLTMFVDIRGSGTKFGFLINMLYGYINNDTESYKMYVLFPELRKYEKRSHQSAYWEYTNEERVNILNEIIDNLDDTVITIKLRLNNETDDIDINTE